LFCSFSQLLSLLFLLFFLIDQNGFDFWSLEFVWILLRFILMSSLLFLKFGFWFICCFMQIYCFMSFFCVDFHDLCKFIGMHVSFKFVSWLICLMCFGFQYLFCLHVIFLVDLLICMSQVIFCFSPVLICMFQFHGLCKLIDFYFAMQINLMFGMSRFKRFFPGL
jgi:hypothetical protein